MKKETLGSNVNVPVFVLERGSQYKGEISEGKYFLTILGILDKLLASNNIESEKVGFSATKMDLASFLADLLKISEFQHAEFQIQIEDTDDFNPDSALPNKF